MLSAWVTQPGSAGTSAQNPPSSALWTMALIFMPTKIAAGQISGQPGTSSRA